jgi:hypothetical protein
MILARTLHRLCSRTRAAALGAAAALSFALALMAPAHAGSETPPVGPPWVKDFVAAQKSALERKLPIFVYLTKTH